MTTHDMPGLKEDELTKCALCGKAHTAPVFYRVSVESCAMDLRAMQRQAGFAAMMGNADIARVMGPDDDMAKIIDTTTRIVCLDCAGKHPVLALV